MTASDIDRLREMGLLPECWSCHGAGKHPQFASDSDGGTCRVCKGTGYDDSSEALAAVAVEQHEHIRTAYLMADGVDKLRLKIVDELAAEKARADKAAAMLAELRLRFTEHADAAAGDRRHTWLDALRYLDALARRSQEKP